MCWPRVGEANPLFPVCIALWRPTALAKIYNVVGKQRNLGLISYHHYLKIVGNNKLCLMTTYAKRKLKYSQNENFNLLHYVEWMGPIRNPRWEQKRTEGYVIVTIFKHEKNNQTLSNDWPTYCHNGIFLTIQFRHRYYMWTIMHAYTIVIYIKVIKIWIFFFLTSLKIKML
jgi:hypothetical protein